MPTTHFGTITEYDQRKGLIFALPDDRSVTKGRRILLPIGSFRFPVAVEGYEPQFIYPGGVVLEPSLERSNKRSRVAFQLSSPEPIKGPRASNWSFRHSWDHVYGEMRRNIMLRVPTGHGEARAWGWEYLGQFAWDEPCYRNPEYRLAELDFDPDGSKAPEGFYKLWMLPLWRVPFTSVSEGVVKVIRQEMHFRFGGLSPQGYILQPPSGWRRHQATEFDFMAHEEVTVTYFIDEFGLPRVSITTYLEGNSNISTYSNWQPHGCKETCHDPARWIQEN